MANDDWLLSLRGRVRFGQNPSIRGARAEGSDGRDGSRVKSHAGSPVITCASRQRLAWRELSVRPRRRGRQSRCTHPNPLAQSRRRYCPP